VAYRLKNMVVILGMRWVQFQQF